MKILYPYNEILPTGRAHDVYLFHNCVSLANAGNEVQLLCGKGSIKDEALGSHYRTAWNEQFSVRQLPIIRRNNPLNLSWNRLFFLCCQRHIANEKPDLVITSVLKQAAYHFKRKVKGARYVFEVHELAWYPQSPKPVNIRAIEEEKEILSQADLIVVTTEGMAKILMSPPYMLTNRIEIVPLAVHARPLTAPLPKKEASPLVISYVGQLYAGQGVDLLLRALVPTEGILLKVIGGSPADVEAHRQLAHSLGVEKKVVFHGFQSPSAMPDLLAESDAFIAPSRKIIEWPYIAHTKLLEYANWGRPLIAPLSSVIKEHLTTEQGVLFYEPDSADSLAQAMEKLKEQSLQLRLTEEIQGLSGRFGWEYRAKRYQDLLRQA